MRWDNLEIVDQCNNLAYGGTRASRPKTVHGRLDFGTRASRPISQYAGETPAHQLRNGTPAHRNFSEPLPYKRTLKLRSCGKDDSKLMATPIPPHEPLSLK